MQKKMVNPRKSRFTIHSMLDDSEAAELACQAVERSLDLVDALWGLAPPEELQIHIMTNWLDFVNDSAPHTWKLLLMLTRPLWQRRVEQTWAVAGGWEQRYGRRVAVGIKPPRLLDQADKRLGERLFVPLDNLNIKMETIICHELTHACSTHLRLPAWLGEGLAMYTVDRYLEYPSVQNRTLEFLRTPPMVKPVFGGGMPSVTKETELLYLYAHGYWTVRWLEEQHPGLLHELLQNTRSKEWEARFSERLNIQVANFHQHIDQLVTSHNWRI